DRIVIALANQKIISDDAAKRREREQHLAVMSAVFKFDFENQTVLFNTQLKMIRATAGSDRLEKVVFQEIEDRNAALMFDIGGMAQRDLFIEIDGSESIDGFEARIDCRLCHVLRPIGSDRD